MDPDKERRLAEAGKVIIGGTMAAVTFEAVRRLLGPLEGSIELLIGGLVGIVCIVLLVLITAWVFTLIEREVPAEEVNLTENQIVELQERLRRSAKIDEVNVDRRTNPDGEKR